MTMINISVDTTDVRRVADTLRGVEGGINDSARVLLRDHFNKDYLPMLRRTLMGFKTLNVPAFNSGRWRKMKAAMGIPHSLGKIPLKGHGHLVGEATGVDADISVSSDGDHIILIADYRGIPLAVPSCHIGYLTIIHEGKDKLHQSYPVIEGTRQMVHNMLLKRSDVELAKIWRRAEVSGKKMKGG